MERGHSMKNFGIGSRIWRLRCEHDKERGGTFWPMFSGALLSYSKMQAWQLLPVQQALCPFSSSWRQLRLLMFKDNPVLKYAAFYFIVSSTIVQNISNFYWPAKNRRKFQVFCDHLVRIDTYISFFFFACHRFKHKTCSKTLKVLCCSLYWL